MALGGDLVALGGSPALCPQCRRDGGVPREKRRGRSQFLGTPADCCCAAADSRLALGRASLANAAGTAACPGKNGAAGAVAAQEATCRGPGPEPKPQFRLLLLIVLLIVTFFPKTS